MRGGWGGRTDGGGQIPYRSALSAGVRDVYPGIQIATQSFVGNDGRRSTTAETSMFIVLSSTALAYVTHDKQL